MNGLFLTLLAIHVGHTLYLARRNHSAAADHEPGGAPPKPINPFAAIVHAPIFVIACYYGYQEGAWTRDLVSPLHIAGGLAAGHLVFVGSVLMTHMSPRDAYETLIDVRDLWRFTWESPAVLSRYITVSVGEEVMWRMAAQPIAVAYLAPLLGAGPGAAAAIVLVAVAFTACHENLLHSSWLVRIEFLLFSLLLGGLYYGTSSLVLVMVIHAVRDIEIVYGEFTDKVHEWKDRERALDHIESQYAMRPGAA